MKTVFVVKILMKTAYFLLKLIPENSQLFSMIKVFGINDKNHIDAFLSFLDL